MLTDNLAQIEKLFAEHSEKAAKLQEEHRVKQARLLDEVARLEENLKKLQSRINASISKGDTRTALTLRVEAENLPLKVAEARLAVIECEASSMAETSRLSRDLHPKVFEVFRLSQVEFSDLEQVWLKISHLNAVSSSTASSASQLGGSLGQQLQSARNQVAKAKAELNSKYQVVA